MNSINLIFTVINRDKQREFIDFFHRHGSEIVYSTPCHGTTAPSFLNYLGLANTEKLLLVSLSDLEHTKKILTGLLYEMKLDYAGNGIVFVIPVQCIGAHALKHFNLPLNKITCNSHESTNTSCSSSSEGKMQPMNGVTMNGVAMNEFNYALIIAITNSGFTDTVMDAARAVGATGGTVVHAKSTATEQVRKFLGISIVEEKEILFIVSKHENKSKIMKGIQDMAGIHTDAGTIVFSVPVDSVAGLHFLPNAANELSE